MDEQEEDFGYEDNGQPPKVITNFGNFKTRKSVEIGVVTSYLPDWTCKEAFREIY